MLMSYFLNGTSPDTGRMKLPRREWRNGKEIFSQMLICLEMLSLSTKVCSSKRTKRNQRIWYFYEKTFTFTSARTFIDH